MESSKPRKSRFSNLAGSFKRSTASLSTPKRSFHQEALQHHGQFFKNLGLGNRASNTSRPEVPALQNSSPAEREKATPDAILGSSKDRTSINRLTPKFGRPPYYAHTTKPMYNTGLMENFETMDIFLPTAQQPAVQPHVSDRHSLSCTFEQSPGSSRKAKEAPAVDQFNDPSSPAVSSQSSLETASSLVSPLFASSASADSISNYSCSTAPNSPITALVSSAGSAWEGKWLSEGKGHPDAAIDFSKNRSVDVTQPSPVIDCKIDLEDDISYSDPLNIPLRKLDAVYRRTLLSDRSTELRSRVINDQEETKGPSREKNPARPHDSGSNRPSSLASDHILEDVLTITSDDLDSDFRSFWPYDMSLHASSRHTSPLSNRDTPGYPPSGSPFPLPPFPPTPLPKKLAQKDTALNPGRRQRATVSGTPRNMSSSSAHPASHKRRRELGFDISDERLAGPGPGPLTSTPVRSRVLGNLSVSDSRVVHQSSENSTSPSERRARGYGKIYGDIRLQVGQLCRDGTPLVSPAPCPQKPLMAYRDLQPLLLPHHILERRAKSSPRRILKPGPAF